MTTQDLLNSVAQLGFETTLEDNDRFFLLANRAIKEVNALRPHMATCKINHLPIENLIEGDTFKPILKSFDSVEYTATGARSYFFECNGNGTAIIEIYSGSAWEKVEEVVMASDGAFKSYKGFIKKDGAFVERSIAVRITFDGEYAFFVKNVAMYELVTSGNIEDIPDYSEVSKYNIASLAKDFYSLVSPPLLWVGENEDLQFNRDYYVEDRKVIVIPTHSNRVGVINVKYNRYPNEIIQTNDLTELIDLDDDLADLLPNLIASYYWVDDEPAKSEYYLARYNEQAKLVIARRQDFKAIHSKSSNNW